MTYTEFMEQQWDAESDYLRGLYKNSFQKYCDNYVKMQGFGPWLESLRGTELDSRICDNIAWNFHILGKRYKREIPSILASISRQYNCELPLIEGILTADYWEKRL